MNRKKVGAAILILAVVGVGLGLFFADRNKDAASEPTSAPKATPAATVGASATPAPAATTQPTIRFTDDGFSPATLTVPVGATVTIQNDSDRTVDFSSDPHPTHTLYPFLNAGDVAPGESATVTIPRAGSFGYHDHLDPSKKGTIIAQ